MQDKPMNGHAHEFDMENAIKEMTPLPSVTIESVGRTSDKPFEQRAHDLLLESIDKVAHEWVDGLQHVRRNSEALEDMVLERVAKIKTDITQLYLLGAAAAAEAHRGDEVNAKLSGELDKLRE